MAEIEYVAVIGAGFMGAGIAQIAAQAGCRVTLIDTNAQVFTKARADIHSSLNRLFDKGVVPEPAEIVMTRIDYSTELARAAEVDFVFEAVTETLAAKRELLHELNLLCLPATIFASNTSAIPVTRLGEASGRPDRTVGMHFFSPVPVNPLLEIIAGAHTSEATLDAAREMGRRLHRHIVEVKRDVPGFIMNRVTGAMVCEAIRLLDAGVGTVEDIDGGLVAGYGMTLGPLAIADLAGLDVCLHAFTNIHTMDPDAQIEAPPLLKRLVAEGKWGRKTCEGFYRYDERGRRLGPAVH